MGDPGFPHLDLSATLDDVVQELQLLRGAVNNRPKGMTPWGLIFTVIVATGILSLIDEMLHSRFRYACQYHTNIQHVQVELRPTDCDFLTAPLGAKRCQYNPVAATDDRHNVYVAWEKVP